MAVGLARAQFQNLGRGLAGQGVDRLEPLARRGIVGLSRYDRDAGASAGRAYRQALG